MSSSLSSDGEFAVPPVVAEVAGVMSTFPGPWCLCGGWAVDAWLGRITRDHGDVDISIFARDQLAAYHHLSEWELVAHDPVGLQDPQKPWDGRHLDLPAHVHCSRDGVQLWEVMLNHGVDGQWVLCRDPWIALPSGACWRLTAWGIPSAVPELLLYYKATAYWGEEGYPRPRDEDDFFALLPLLSPDQRAWLHRTIALTVPEQPWLTRFSP